MLKVAKMVVCIVNEGYNVILATENKIQLLLVNFTPLNLTVIHKYLRRQRNSFFVDCKQEVTAYMI